MLLETCDTCGSTQRRGTPCRCPFDDDGPTNDRTRYATDGVANVNRVSLANQYTHANVCADGGLFCRACALSESVRLADVDPTCPDDDQWRIIGTQFVAVFARCDHCGHLVRTPIT